MQTQQLTESQLATYDAVIAFVTGRDPDRLRALMTEDVRVHDWMAPQDVLVGPNAVLDLFLAPIAAAFPDARFEIHDVVVGDRKAVVCGDFTGTFTNEYYGVPPHGRQVHWAAHDIYALAAGGICEIWFGNDTLQVARELGALPAEARPW